MKPLSRYASLLIVLLAFPPLAFAAESNDEMLRDLQRMSFPLVEAAAKAGDPNAQIILGYEYFTGNRIGKDYTKALSHYREAAQKGSLVAMSNICNFYLNGYGVEKDYVLAFQWCQEPANAGDANAMVMIAEIFAAGDGPSKDKPQSFREIMAFRFNEMAATRGHKLGQFRLGKFYEMGMTVEKNPNQALNWYQKSAAQGYEPAINAVRRVQLAMGVDDKNKSREYKSRLQKIKVSINEMLLRKGPPTGDPTFFEVANVADPIEICLKDAEQLVADGKALEAIEKRNQCETLISGSAP